MARLALLTRLWGKPEYRACLVLMVLMSLGTSSGMPLISLFLVHTLGAGLSVAGLFSICTALPGLFLGVYLGRRSDHWRSRLPFLRAATAWVGAGWLAIAFAPAAVPALIAGAVFLSAGGILSGQVFSLLHDVMARDGEEQPELITTIVRTGWSFGFIFGPFFGTVLAAQLGFRQAFIAAGCLYLVCLLPQAFLHNARPEASRREQAGTLSGGINLPLLSFTALCALVISGQAIKNTYLPIDVTSHLGGTVRTYGTIVAVSPMVEVIAMPLSGVLAQHMAIGRVIAAGLVMAVIEYIVLFSSTLVWQLYLTQAMDACVVAVVMGLGVAYAQRLSPGRPGAANGIFFSSFNVAFILGGAVGSAGVPLLGVPHVFLIPVAFSAVAVLGFLYLDGTHRRHTQGAATATAVRQAAV